MKFAARLEINVESAAIAQQLLDRVRGYLVEHGASPKLETIEPHAQDRVHVFTDGGCDIKKNGVGAWAYVAIYPDGREEEAAKGCINTTNNRMELMGLISALEAMEMGLALQVFCDSEYVVKGLTMWCRNWVRNGWKTADGKDVKNVDLWTKLLPLYQLHDMVIAHVKGHNGNHGNERADALCTAAMVNTHKAFLALEKVDVDERVL